VDEGAQIIELSARIDELALQRARLVSRFDAARGYESHGSPNTVAFLKSRCNLSVSAAMEVVTVARRLGELPAVEAAVERGQIGFQQAAVIAESADLLTERQDEIVAKAEDLDPSRLRLEVKKVAMQVDAERIRREAEWSYRSRRLQVTTMGDGRVRLDGLLDAEGGALVKTALGAALGPRSKDETRTEAQRKADALVDVAGRALEGRQFGETGCQRPHLNITVELETLIGLRDEPASLNGNAPLVLDTVERYLCDAGVSMTALLDGEVVMAGKERRTFSPALRRALMATQPHCQHEGGCDRPVEWCEGHHLLSWLLGGKTTADNGQLLCKFHHRLAHAPPAA
jgi:uncharacterized protein DUF222